MSVSSSGPSILDLSLGGTFLRGWFGNYQIAYFKTENPLLPFKATLIDRGTRLGANSRMSLPFLQVILSNKNSASVSLEFEGCNLINLGSTETRIIHIEAHLNRGIQNVYVKVNETSMEILGLPIPVTENIDIDMEYDLRSFSEQLPSLRVTKASLYI